jgi:hypothetical protein
MEQFVAEVKKKANVVEEKFALSFWDGDFDEWVAVKDFSSIPTPKIKIKIVI